ncbi:MAG: DedA family protein [Candidatus ainarchaeum sp.]|nr:DedA family protein [Candidatus ainarchaeum sp.]
MFEELILFLSDYLTGFVGHLLVFLLMTIESSFIPFPSEIVMVPAGTFAYVGNLNIFLVILLGTLGSVFGALINYSIGYYLGRRYLLRHQRIFFINVSHLEKAEFFFKKYGSSATFFARLIPVVRQYISIPAGFSKMPLKNFILYTFLGSFLWVSFLTILGYKLGEEISKSVLNYFNVLMIVLVGLVVLSIAFWYFLKKTK